MRKTHFTFERNGFHGTWYPCESDTDKGIILMLGDSSDDRMAAKGAKWLNEKKCHVMAMSPAEKDYGHHNYPLEVFSHAIKWMKAHGAEKIGICGASTTGMAALCAASYYPDITLTIAVSPSDFIMEGFYQDGLDGAHERPGNHESTLTWQGKPLAYLPFAYRHPEYWQKLKEEAKEGGNLVASRKMFDESERLHPLEDEEKIKVEKIRGKVICIGAEDDCLWDTCRYIRRMEERLKNIPHTCDFESWLYEHGTHFAFPESMLKMILPVGSSLFVSLMFKEGRKHRKECLETRKDIDRRLSEALNAWQGSSS